MGMHYFCSEVVVTKEEKASAQHVIAAAENVLMLTNDYYSWEKEHREYMTCGQTGHLTNAVAVLMKSREIDASAAKSLLREELIRYEQIFCDTRDRYMSKANPEPGILRLVTLLELGIPGNGIWHATSARYHEPAPLPTRTMTRDIRSLNGASMGSTSHDKESNSQPTGKLFTKGKKPIEQEMDSTEDNVENGVHPKVPE